MILDLAGVWELSDETGEWRCPMRVPGDGITALFEAGLIPDPYWGRNEEGLRWIAERDWTIRRRFSLELGRADLLLVLDGIDTVAEVTVNGEAARGGRGGFRPRSAFRAHLALLTTARAGENEVAITFRSAPREAARLATEQPFPVPFAAQNSPIPYGNMLRKPACDWGWDWNLALCPFGVTGGVRVQAVGAHQVDQVMVRQRHEDGTVHVEVRFLLLGHPSFVVSPRCTVTFAGQTAEVVYLGGKTGGRAAFALELPALWWPVGLGPQTLHDLEVRVGDAVARRRIGLRTVELVSEKDAAGLSFGLRVNGVPVFARGANWIPADALAGRITEEKTRALLQSAVAANMNMIRVWGGGRYEPDSFYDACDELGLMVWQDFMFACNLYPSTPDFLREVDAEVREQAARLHHHACLALWCGDNELVGALDWFEESRKDRDRYLVSYDRLNRTIETALKETVPDANWWPSSPSTGPLSFGDAWHDDSSGDMHMWSVWHEGRDVAHYRDVRPRFCSEFGFQSYPSMDVIRTFAAPGDWNIASPVLESHQKNKGGNARIAETMFRTFRWPERFEDFVWLSQVQQGLAVKTAVEAWRSLKPHCQGTLYWQLNDTWPACSWSSLDYGGGWKILHHMARCFYRPLHVMAVPNPEGVALVASNDSREPLEVTVTAHATALDGAAREVGRASAQVGTEAAQRLLLVPEGAVGPAEVLAFGWEAADGARGDGLHNPRPWKAYDLPDPRLDWSVREEGGAHVLTLAASAMAFFVTPEADVPGAWDRAAVHRGPGPSFAFRFTPRDPGAAPAFLVRDLWSATTRRHP